MERVPDVDRRWHCRWRRRFRKCKSRNGHFSSPPQHAWLHIIGSFMRLIIHIGTHKTGSTAIQRFLSHNREAVAARGVCYPTAHTANYAQHPLAWALGVNHPQRDPSLAAEDIARDIVEEARSASAQLLVISSEDFESVVEPAAIERLKQLFQDFPTEIVVYIRRQDEALWAAYNQRVKSFDSRLYETFEEFGKQPFLSNRLNYWALLQRWATVFGEDAMRVRLYDRRQFEKRNIIFDFLSIAGIDPEGLEAEQWGRINKSIHPLAVEILRRTNSKKLPREVHRVLLKLLNQVLAKQGPPAPAMAGTRPDFMAQFAESNALVAKKWLEKSDGELFSEPATPLRGKAENGVYPSDALLVDVLIDSLIKYIRDGDAPGEESPLRVKHKFGRRPKRPQAESEFTSE
jgi:hypothetical protein